MSEILTPKKRDGVALERHNKIVENLESNNKSIDILFIGDSITQQWETIGNSILDEFFQDYHTFNFGVSGDQIQHVFWRLENSPLETIDPQAVVLLIGTNHYHSPHHTTVEIFTGIQHLTETVHSIFPDATLILMGIFPRGDHFNEYRGKIAQMNESLRKMGEQINTHFLDINHHFLNPDGSLRGDLLPDRLHLSQEGYRVWAEALKPVVEKYIGEANQDSDYNE